MAKCGLGSNRGYHNMGDNQRAIQQGSAKWRWSVKASDIIRTRNNDEEATPTTKKEGMKGVSNLVH